MKNRFLKIGYLVLTLLLITLPHPAFAQSETDIGDDYVPLVFGDNAFSMLYPVEWVFDDEPQDSFNFASDASLFDAAPEQAFEPGDVRVSLALIPSESAYDPDTPVLDTFAEVIVNSLLEPIDGAFPPSLFPALPQLLPSPDDATKVARLLLNYGDLGEARMYFWQLTDHVYGLANLTTAVGESEAYEPTVLVMIESTTLNIEFTAESFAAGSDQ